jgi:sensor histidine kinase YesM
MKGLHAAYRFVLRYRILHVLFWTWTTLSFAHVLYQRTHRDFGLSLAHSITHHVLQMVCVYTVIWILVPRHFDKGRYTRFFVSALAILLVIGVLGTIWDMSFTYLTEGKHIRSPLTSFISKVFDTAVVTGIFVAIVVIQKRLEADSKSRHLEREQMRAELDFLKAQINPHFLFNTINNIYVLIQEDKKTGNEMLLRFSELLRYQLYECSEERVSISQEIRFIRNFIEMEKLRVGDAVKVDVHIAEEHGFFEIAPFILLPFVENAFKHVSRHDGGGNFIHISSQTLSEVFHFAVGNTYDENPRPIQPGGIGLQNVRRRLELIYPQRHSLDIRKEAGMHTLDFKLHVR